MTKIGRNDKCPCGSGKKYKQCCMKKGASRAAEMAQMNDDVSQTLSSAFSLHQTGRISEAEELYQKILRRDPHHPDALHLLGVIIHQHGNNELAAEYVYRAIAANPSNPDYYRNMGVILQELGRMDEAVNNYRRALSFTPSWRDSLRRLTTPLVLTSGMDLSRSVAQKSTIDGKQPDTPEGHEGLKSAQQNLYEAGPHDSAQAHGKKLRIVLLYPPPWKIGSAPAGMPSGAPKDAMGQSWNDDFQNITYGLMTIAAQARRAGHTVRLYNISSCDWQDVVKLIAEDEADVYGISAFTANRRGLGAVASLIRKHHPNAHITAGGPFVTALPVDTMKYYKDLDTVVIGEGETTFMELLEALISGGPTAGIPGTAWRNGDDIAVAPPRPRIDDLDSLASPFDYFTSNTVMTSRGCPSQCTFCGSYAMWGRKLKFLSVQACIDTFRKALARVSIPFLVIKDDTFTADRRRAIAICDAIIENGINFLWSCDTRVDCLDDELLRKMRLAGCQIVSFGVESGSPEILKSIRKETTSEKVLEATRIAQKYGMHVRYYLILLNRGESIETIRQSVGLIKEGRPSSYLFCPMAYHPGTEDWEILSERQGLSPDIFFRNDFLELSAATNRQFEYQEMFLKTVCDIGTIGGFNYTVEEREAIADRLPQVAIVHVELANAYLLASRFSDAWTALNRAEQLGFPISSIIDNQRACIALARGETDNALAFLEQALQAYPNIIVKGNMEKLKAWLDDPTINRNKPPVLNSSVLLFNFLGEKSHSSRVPL